MLGNDRRRYTFMLACAALALIPTVASGQIFHVPTATPEQGKAFSEFNHRMAGVFLLAIGFLAAAANLPKMKFFAKIWPFFFILPGLYLAAMSDPEVWPMGTQSWLEAFRVNPEGRQHKIFALLLIALGVLEVARAAGKLGRGLATWSFPAMAVFGATLLFFHPHTLDESVSASSPTAAMAHEMPGHDMAGMKHDAPAAPRAAHEGHVMTGTMIKVQNQHLWFSLVGFGIALFKFLHDGGFWLRPFVPFLWPTFMAMLGVLLMLYAE
jgi:hypothetical protein